MSSQPYLRATDDGTFELLVPSGTGSVYVLPYCFHTEEDAVNWLASRKGKARIQRVNPPQTQPPCPKSIESLVAAPRPIAAEVA